MLCPFLRGLTFRSHKAALIHSQGVQIDRFPLCLHWTHLSYTTQGSKQLHIIGEHCTMCRLMKLYCKIISYNRHGRIFDMDRRRSRLLPPVRCGLVNLAVSTLCSWWYWCLPGNRYPLIIRQVRYLWSATAIDCAGCDQNSRVYMYFGSTSFSIHAGLAPCDLTPAISPCNLTPAIPLLRSHPSRWTAKVIGYKG